ncbi:hypothetical protein Fot_05661 [Forsythia ovata]|uniref:Uncharacterized protein n=1 Tax=Forsythia ovata TaxID=205694 RepID=A0ABD1WQR2_9LAMI
MEENDKSTVSAPTDSRQTILVPTATAHGLQFMAQKQKVGAKRSKKESAKGAVSEEKGSSKRSLTDEDDLEILEEEGLSKKARKPRTASSRSSQNLAAQRDEIPVIEEEEEEVAETEEGYDHSVHIKKIFQSQTSKVSAEALGLLPTHLRRATTTIDFFWTESWVAYSEKSFAEDKLKATKVLTTQSLVLIEEAEISVSDLELKKINVAKGSGCCCPSAAHIYAISISSYTRPR